MSKAGRSLSAMSRQPIEARFFHVSGIMPGIHLSVAVTDVHEGHDSAQLCCIGRCLPARAQVWPRHHLQQWHPCRHAAARCQPLSTVHTHTWYQANTLLLGFCQAWSRCCPGPATGPGMKICHGDGGHQLSIGKPRHASAYRPCCCLTRASFAGRLAVLTCAVVVDEGVTCA